VAKGRAPRHPKPESNIVLGNVDSKANQFFEHAEKSDSRCTQTLEATHIPHQILLATASLLAPYVKGLSATKLETLLQSIDASSEAEKSDFTDKLIDKHEAAQLLGVQWFTVYRMIRDGQLPAVKIRKQWRIKMSTIRDIFSNNCLTQ
jgi:excisionase family DNA binding protein